MVQRPRQAKLDARPGDHWADLADSLPDHPGQFRVRIRTGDPKESAVARGVALCNQPRGEPDLHTDPIRDAEPAAGGGGHFDRLGHNHLDGDRCLATFPLGRIRPRAVLRVGVVGDCAATVDHDYELVN